MARGFEMCPGKGFFYPQQRSRTRRANRRQPKHQQPQARAQMLREIGSDNPRHGYTHVTGEFVDTDGEAALIAMREIEFGGLRHRPGKTLIDT